MPIQIECSNQQENFDCCGGGTSAEIFTGLIVTDAGAIQARIYRPFEAFVSSVGQYVFLSDYKGNRYTANLSDSVYSTMQELVTAVNNCRSSSIRRFSQYFPGASGPVISITENGGVLPANGALIDVFYRGQLLTEGVDYNVSGSDIVLTFSPKGFILVKFFIIT